VLELAQGSFERIHVAVDVRQYAVAQRSPNARGGPSR
jgi:hypothetical protein